MNGYQGPLLSYIARNDQSQKLVAAAQARLAMSMRADKNPLPGWIPLGRAQGTAVRLRHFIHQCLTVVRADSSLRHVAWRPTWIEDSDVLDPRLSS